MVIKNKKPKLIKRSDAGKPRAIPEGKMLQYCEIIAALKIRTTNKQGRHISTVTALDVLESTGVESEYGFIKLPKGLLNKPTVNRYLSLYGLDKSNLIKNTPAVRFQAEHSNECWQFDLSPSDLKSVDEARFEGKKQRHEDKPENETRHAEPEEHDGISREHGENRC